ncbi:UNVERIFIED_CONTAM: hypothetical protein PYX00_002086 [Menopon gallinae]|uniref:Protein transport protein Sec24C n=1 Tax=Menopon gallinae TaxID=328185 RepID=A0AAW2IH23_9NEOP
MNPQMMQFGSQIGGCRQPENYTRPGGGPPPPSGNYPPGSYPNMPQQGAAPPPPLPQDYNQQKYPQNIMPGMGQPPPPSNQNFQNGPMSTPGNLNKPTDGMPPNMGFQKPDGAPQNMPSGNVGTNTAPYPTNVGVQLSNQMQAMNISGLPTTQSSRTPMGGPPPPTGLQMQNANQSQSMSGPVGPQMPNVDGQFTNQQYGTQINGTMPPPSMGLPPSGQNDMYRQNINNGPQSIPQQRPPQQGPTGGPPLGYGAHDQNRPVPGQMPGPGRAAVPPYSNPNQMSSPMPPLPGSNLSHPGMPPLPNQPMYQNSDPSRPQYPPMGDMYSGEKHTSGDLNQNYPPRNLGYGPTPQPQPGYNANYASQTNQTYPQQQQSQRRLDPDMLPSPLQVMQDDEKNRSGLFYTNQKGLTPPLVTTKFITQDQGNCSPRYIRSTMYTVPVTADMMKQTSVPFALVISPLARLAKGEQAPPIVNMGELGPVRCVRCKAYMSPFMQFIDGGRRFHCLFCKATTEVPGEYFQHLDHTGQRVDRFERPELILGAYEFMATKDYCRNNTLPLPPAMIFVIDVSYNNMKSGLVHLLCSRMKEIIRNLPKEDGAEQSNMKVGFITYSTSVHFYNIKSCLAAPQMMLVGDVEDMFMPLLDGFLCDPIESEGVIDLLMNEIPQQFAETRETEVILYPAIQAGLEALKASGCAGKLLVFHSSLPIGEAPGKLKNRDDRKLLNTDKEKQVLGPQNNSYNNLGQQCVQAGCSVDLFIFNNSYVDIATIGQVSRLTGGEIFKYTYFQAGIDGERFISDLKRAVSRQIVFDAIMRVRTSTGVRATDFYGHLYMSNTTDMELAAIDSDKAVAVEIKHDDKLTEEDGVYIQVALLFTSCSGQRRLRVLNLSLKTCSQMADLYRSCDLDTTINFFAKQGMFKLLESSPKQLKSNLVTRCATILACYRKNCASPSSVGQLILPECMKLLPLYINTLMKSDAFCGGSDMTCDDRSYAMHCVIIMDVSVSVVYFYPRLIELHTIDPDSVDPPVIVRCTAEKLQPDGVYLLDNGIHMFMWLGLSASTEFISNVFGVPTSAQVDTDKTSLPALDNPLSLKIRHLIESIREERHRSMRLTLVKERDKLEVVFKHFLMEDRGADGSPSYVDFLCHMHKEIRNLLS